MKHIKSFNESDRYISRDKYLKFKPIEIPSKILSEIYKMLNIKTDEQKKKVKLDNNIFTYKAHNKTISISYVGINRFIIDLVKYTEYGNYDDQYQTNSLEGLNKFIKDRY